MTTTTNIAKNSASLSGIAKPSDHQVFYGWMFYFTRLNLATNVASITKRAATLTHIAKH